jgi:hypothetical protein
MPAAPTVPPDTRRDLIASRKQRSLTWRVIHVLGSLKFALFLLATIAIACAAATIYESRFDTKVAQAYIYKAPWFVCWLGLLCINLFAVTLTRWPWQRKHLGFVITHYGIITLLIGAVLGSKFGFEGNVTLHKGAPPVDRIVTSDNMVQIINLSSGQSILEPFDAQLARPSERRPTVLAVPGSDWKISIDGNADALGWADRLVADDSAKAGPGVVMTFSTLMMGQRITLPFILTDGKPMTRDFAGLASVTFTSELPTRAPFTLTESHVVFTKFAPIVQGQEGASTGIEATLSADGAVLAVKFPSGRAFDFDRGRILKQPQRVEGATITLSEYWPDFALTNGKPGTRSDQPNNPAALVRIEAPRQLPGGKAARPHLEMAPAPDGIAYQLGRGDYFLARSAAKVGETFPLGWADWKATVSESLPRARMESDRTPAPKGEPGVPGFQARLVAPDGRKGPAQWIGSGDSPTLDFEGQKVRIGYGLSLRRVPFSIELKNFEVPRMEGTDEPANFIATVEFRDLATGATKEGVAQMNEPASWPGTAFALTTGLNYKFSQAKWNPQNLGETTLQVLYDPGWLFKWTGSLAICCGIFIMFYLRPKKS